MVRIVLFTFVQDSFNLRIGVVSPKPPKIPARQIEPRYDRIQVDGLPVAAEGVVAIHVDVAPSRR